MHMHCSKIGLKMFKQIQGSVHCTSHQTFTQPVGQSLSQQLGNDFEGFFDFVTQQRVPDTGLMEWQMIVHIICSRPPGIYHFIILYPAGIFFGMKWVDLFLCPVLVIRAEQC